MLTSNVVSVYYIMNFLNDNTAQKLIYFISIVYGAELTIGEMRNVGFRENVHCKWEMGNKTHV